MNTTKKQDRLTLRVEECADLLGICRSAAYNLVRQAESSKGKPFQVIRIGNSLLISRVLSITHRAKGSPVTISRSS